MYTRSAICSRRTRGLKEVKNAFERKEVKEMSKDYGYPSFELICKASSGDEMAVKEILKFYDGYISKLCLRPFYHSESGKIIMQVDEELKGEIHTDMMKAILKFEIGVK